MSRRVRSSRLLCFAALMAGALGVGACRKAEPAAPVPPAAKSEAPAPAAAALPEPVKKMMGKWLRSDGGYVLEIKGAEVSGVLQAGYFNPKPINVSRAIWMQGAAGFQVVVELNDVGYPGATYVLTYDPQADRLAGQYNQPAMQQSFDIDFVRQGPYKP